MLTNAQRDYLTTLVAHDRAGLVQNIAYVRATEGNSSPALARLHAGLPAIDAVLSSLAHEPVRVAA
jgi:hypothetical protein